MNIMVIIILGFILFIIFILSIFYVRTTKNTRKKAIIQNKKNNSINNQAHTKAQLSVYGVLNQGTSMDDGDIYEITPSDMGL